MQIVKLTSWDMWMTIITKHYITLSQATILLTDYLYNKSEEHRLNEIKKFEFNEIIRKQVRKYWTQWEFSDGLWESADWDIYFSLKDNVREHIKSLYPELTEIAPPPPRDL